MNASIEQVGGSNLKGLAPAAQGESWLRPRIVPDDTTTRHYVRCREDGNYIEEFVVVNPVGEQRVFTIGEDGNEYRWGCYHRGPNVIVFYPHDAYAGGDVIYVHGFECKSVRMEPEAEKLFFFGGSDGDSSRTGRQDQGLEQGQVQAEGLWLP